MPRRVVVVIGPDGVDSVYSNDEKIETFFIDASLLDDEEWEATVLNEGKAIMPGTFNDFAQAAGDFDPQVATLIEELLGPASE
jgi:hypothetical protein